MHCGGCTRQRTNSKGITSRQGEKGFTADISQNLHTFDPNKYRSQMKGHVVCLRLSNCVQLWISELRKPLNSLFAQTTMEGSLVFQNARGLDGRAQSHSRALCGSLPNCKRYLLTQTRLGAEAAFLTSKDTQRREKPPQETKHQR